MDPADGPGQGIASACGPMFSRPVTGWASGVVLARSSGGQILCGCLCGQFGAGGDAELGEDVGQVHLDGAGGDEQAPGDGVVPQAFADKTDDLQLSGGQAGPARGGALASAALAGGIG